MHVITPHMVYTNYTVMCSIQNGHDILTKLNMMKHTYSGVNIATSQCLCGTKV